MSQRQRIATRVAQDFFNSVQLDAGILVKGWDPTDPTNISDEMIVCATTGGLNPTCVPTYSDLFEDVDNAPNNTKEGLHLDSWACGISTTAVQTTPEAVRLALGAADIVGNKITPRTYIKGEDFDDLAWLGDMADGGIAACVLKNALSSGGYSMQTNKNGKGNLALSINGYATIEAQDDVPMEFYVIPGSGTGTTYTYTAASPVGSEDPSDEGWYVLIGDSYRPTTDTTVDSNVTYYERTAVV